MPLSSPCLHSGFCGCEGPARDSGRDGRGLPWLHPGPPQPVTPTSCLRAPHAPSKECGWDSGWVSLSSLPTLHQSFLRFLRREGGIRFEDQRLSEPWDSFNSSTPTSAHSCWSPGAWINHTLSTQMRRTFASLGGGAWISSHKVMQWLLLGKDSDHRKDFVIRIFSVITDTHRHPLLGHICLISSEGSSSPSLDSPTFRWLKGSHGMGYDNREVLALGH